MENCHDGTRNILKITLCEGVLEMAQLVSCKEEASFHAAIHITVDVYFYDFGGGCGATNQAKLRST